MSLFLDKIKELCRNQWVIGLFLLAVFLATNGYTYAWDDQHLEIPLLKKLIDPTLYPGDYYVETLTRNFPSFLYPLLAKVITVAQVPTAYLLLYLVSRYFLFFWVYKIWHLLSGRRLIGVYCTVMLIVMSRVEEFLYRTFSHQEFALAVIFAGIYFFYKERFLLASILLGVAANFHLLYSLFPYSFLFIYLLWQNKKHGWQELGRSALAFCISALPVIIWVTLRLVRKAGTPGPATDEWIALYKIACPQNFIFYTNSPAEVFRNGTLFLELTLGYWTLLAYYMLNLAHNEEFRKDKKSQVVIWAGAFFVVVCYIFTYVFPVRLINDLNLIRYTQFMLFILVGYTAMLVAKTAETKKWGLALAAAAFFPLFKFANYIRPLAAVALACLLGISAAWQKTRGPRRTAAVSGLFLALVLVAFLAVKEFIRHNYFPQANIAFFVIYGLLIAIAGLGFILKSPSGQMILRRLLIIIPLTVFSVYYMAYHARHIRVERTGGGFWELQREWIDMQKYVRKNVPKDALILVPHDMEMGGFRIFSERKIICSYRDCGVIGFDYPAAVEWQTRLNDIGAFQVFIKQPIQPAIVNALLKYQADYIVFMGYVAPESNSVLTRIYANKAFALYKVTRAPIDQQP